MMFARQTRLALPFGSNATHRRGLATKSTGRSTPSTTTGSATPEATMRLAARTGTAQRRLVGSDARVAIEPAPRTALWTHVWDNGWIEPEADELIARAYKRHRALADRSCDPIDSLTTEELETLGKRPQPRYPARTISDRVAKGMVRALAPLTHMFFRDRYNHHAVVLETVAAVPGLVGGMFRHLRSLRRMDRDHGWINPLLEEGENERMHLLTWMKVTQPSSLEKLLVIGAQGVYWWAYATLYLFTPRTAHRFVGYLEEEAVEAYTDFLNAIDAGELPNGPAPRIAIEYWNLPDDATVRDVVLQVRADEMFHRNVNHFLSQAHDRGETSQTPKYPGLH